MPSIADVRKDFPQLADRSDDEVVDAVHKAFYSDLPREHVAKAFGVKEAAPAPKAATLGDRAKDVGVSLARGGVGAVQGVVGLADLATGGRAGKALEDSGVDLAGADQYWADKYSDTQKAANKRVEDASKGEEGDSQDLTAKIGRVGMAALSNPSVIVHSIIQSAPSIAAGGAYGRALAAVVPRAAAAAGAFGEGVVTAGQQAEQIRADPANTSRTLDGQQAALAGGSGLVTAAIGRVLGGVSRKLGFEDIDSLAAGVRGDIDASRRAVVSLTHEGRKERGTIAKFLGGGAFEGTEELLQSAQEQMAQNLALGKPIDDGLDQAIVLGTLSGAGMGLGAQAFHRGVPRETASNDRLKSAGDLIREDKQPGTGPSSTAVNAGVEVAATAADLTSPPLEQQEAVGPRRANANTIAQIRALEPDQQKLALDYLNLGNNLKIEPHVRRHAQNQLDVLLGTTQGPEEQAAPPTVDGAEPVAAVPEVAPPAPGNSQDAELAALETQAREGEARTAFEQRNADKPPPPSGKRTEGDIVATHGGPFKTMRAAMRVQAENPGSEILPVDGGLVVRPKAEDDLGKPAAAGRDREAPAAAAAAADGVEAPAGVAGGQPDGGAGDVGRALPGAGEPGRARPVQPQASNAPLIGGAPIAAQPKGTRGTSASDLDLKAHEAAPSPQNDLPEPTDGQKEAGNYKKGHIRLQGLDISVENPQGSVRRGKGKDGVEWQHEMSHHYGYIKRTTGGDGEQVDVYVGPKPDATHAYVIDQIHQDTGAWDEHKAMLGFGNQGAAVRAYRQNFDKGWKVGPVTAMPMEEFKAWVQSDEAKKPLQEVKPAAAAPAEDAPAARWTRMTSVERDAALTRAGWLGGPKQAGVAASAWDQLRPAQQERIAAAMDGNPVSTAEPAKEDARARRARLQAEKAAPPSRQPGDTMKPIGRNADGDVIREDANGVRHVSRGGVRISEKVMLRPTREGLRQSVEHTDRDFIPVAPLERVPQNEAAAEPVASRDVSGEAQASPSAAASNTTPAQVAPGPASEPAPVAGSGNTIFTDEAAEKAREILRSKLGINKGKRGQAGGLDPDVLAAGVTLAGYHIEKGARKFGAFVKAMVDDLGDGIRPYLKSFFLAAKFDPRAAALDGLSTAAEVESFDVDAPVEGVAEPAPEAQDTARGSPARQLEEPAPSAPEGAPAQDAQGPAKERGPGGASDVGSGSDVAGDADGARAGDGARPGVGAGAGEPVPARGAGRKRGGPGKPRVAERGGREPDAGLFGRVGDAPNAPTVGAVSFDFKITEDFDLGGGGPKAKYNGNVAAIRLLKQLDAGVTMATPDQQSVLAKYVGWGGLAPAFDASNKDWAREHAELKDLLTPEEYDLARQSTQFAHYTSRPVINGIYGALARMGFTGGRVLEPGSGVGNFIGLMPEALRPGVRFTGVERESIAWGIARHLYPQQNIQRADFTEFGAGNDGLFDAVVGNPPFSRTTLNDASGRKHLSGLSVHNYFFAKAVDMLRPGGVLAQVVTSSFLDAKKDTARRYIAERTRFLGAIRLPNNAFAKNAGTEVTTDIVFLQKLPEAEWNGRAGKENRESWLETAQVADSKGGLDLNVNQWFADHPDMMLGDFGRHGTMYGPDQAALVARAGQDTPALLAAAIAKLPEGVYTAPAVAGTADVQGRVYEALKDTTVQEGGHYVDGDKLYRRVGDEAGEGRAVEVTPETQWTEKTKLGEPGFAKIVALSKMRRTLRELLAAEMANDAGMEQLRRNLGRQYDAYVATHGFINDRASARVFEDDPDFPLLASLEHAYTPGISAAAARKQGLKPIKATAKKGPIFEKRVLEQRAAPTRADSPTDALSISIAERGRIDVGYIGQLLGKDGDAALAALTEGDRPLLFKDPALGEHVLRDAYLSGNVRVKLAQAREAGMFQNAKALEAVQPEDVGAHEISVRAGAPWVPPAVYQDFAAHLLGEGTKANLTFLPVNGSFVGSITPGNAVASTNTWGTQRMPADELLFRVLNNREIKVIDRDSDGTSHVNVQETENANQKASEIRTAFQDWVFKDSDRSEQLVRSYNDTNNNYVTRAFDGSYLTFPGKVPDDVIKFRRHQRNAAARVVQDRTTLLDHVVGAGKTFTVVSAAMELKRTGLARKSMVMVPNHLVKQWAADFYRLYPGANVLTATKKDFEKANRRRFLAKIATGEWDAVVIAHSSFGFIKPDPAFEQTFNEQQIATIVSTIQAVESSDTDGAAKKRTVKQLEALRDRLKERIKSLRDKPMDALLDFKEVGVDQLFVDEAHLFKNLMFTTKMQNVRGLGDPAGSQRAYDLYVKAAQIYQQNGRGQGVVFATGTPVSNSLAEMYHMMRYLMPDVMADQFPSFDAWANTFAAVEPVWMQKVSGDGFKASNRMSTFVNTPELLKLFDQVSDTVTMEDIKAAYREENDGREFPLPKLKDGRRTPVSLKKSAAQEAYMTKLAARAKAIEGQRTNTKGSDNALKIMGDGRKAAMDIRLVDLDVTDREPGGRIDRATDEVIARWKQYDKVKGTQLVFSDLGTPIAHAKAEMREWEALNERIEKGAGEAVQTRANLGDPAALEAIEDAEAAQEEMNAKGSDWLDAVRAAMRGFSVYDDFRAALVEKGMPIEQIAFIHDFNTDDRKADLFRKVNNGTIRVLLGSTSKMGAGTNVQERAVAEHHLDVPWKPSDVEQREGRIIRQGNALSDGPQALPDFEVEILAYVTQDTLDMRMWQVQETKLKMINQLRARKIGREIDNAFEDMEMSAGEMQAAATGNMDLLNEIKLRTDVRKLEQAARSYDAQRSDLESRRKRTARDMAEIPQQLAKAKRGAALSDEYLAARGAEIGKFSIDIDGTVYTDRGAASEVLRAMVDAVETDDKGKERPKPIDVTVNGQKITARAALGEAFAEAAGDSTFPMLTIDGKQFNRISTAAKVLMPRIADALADQKEVELGTMGPFRVTGEGGKNSLGSWLELTVEAPGGIERGAQIVVKSAGEDGVRRVAEQAISTAANLAEAGKSEAAYLEHSLERTRKTAADLDKLPPMGDWPNQGKLDEARAKHKEILDRLKAPAAAPAPAGQVLDSQDNRVARDGLSPERAEARAARAAKVERVVESIVSGWKTPPKVNIISRDGNPAVPGQIWSAPAAVMRNLERANTGSTAVLGMFHAGEIWLVSDNLRNDRETAETLMHEALGHLGLRATYGQDLGTVLDRIAILNAGKVRAKAQAYKLDFNKTSDRRVAAEEVLAEMAQSNPQLGWVQRAVAAIRTWLREHMPGYKSMQLSDDEIVRTYLVPARGALISGSGDTDALTRAAANVDTSVEADAGPQTLNSLKDVLNDVGDARLPAGYIVSDLFNGTGKLGWWHKTIGTMFNLAQRSPAFKRVYDAAQRMLNDTSQFAGDTADLAPRILPKLEKWKDIGKSPLSAADTKAMAAPIFEGTLSWVRDEQGKPVRLADRIAAAEKMDTETKAHELFKAGLVSEAELKRWQATPLDVFDGAVNNRYAREYLAGGVVWTPEELRSQFHLTGSLQADGKYDGQIGLYQEFRAAIDRSIGDLALSEMLRVGGKDIPDALRAQVLGTKGDHDGNAMKLRDFLWEQADADPKRASVLNASADRIVQLADKANGLIKRGYAPLSRFGQLSLDVVSPAGVREHFGLYETKRERARAAREMKANFPDATITLGTVSQEAHKLFQGVSPETIELFGELLGLDSTGADAKDQAFQQAIKLTQSNRSSMRRLLHRKGIAGFSEDAGRVLAGFVVSNARRTSQNLHSGEMDAAIVDIEKNHGELKDAAVRLREYLKNPVEEAQAIRGLLFAQYLGGSVASAIINSTQPATVTFPWLSQFGGAVAAAKQMKGGMADAVKFAKTQTTGDKALDAALLGSPSVSPQEIHQLMAQSGGGGHLLSGDGTRAGDAWAKSQNALKKVGLAWGKVFSIAEQFNRRTTFIAGYRTAQAQGLGDPIAFAERAVAETQFTYNKANKPQWARGALGATLFTFKQYSVNYLELLGRMYQAGPEGKKAALLALGVLFLMSGADGLPFADDVDDLIDGFAQRIMGINFSSKTAKRAFFAGILGDDYGRILERGFSAMPGIPLDVSGRFSLGNLIPGTGFATKKDDHSRDALEMLGPVADVGKRAAQALSDLLSGHPVDALKGISPTATRNILQGIDMLDKGAYLDAKRNKVVDTDTAEAFLKMIGFQPAVVARIQQSTGEVMQMVGLYKIVQSELNAAMARAVADDDGDAKEAVRATRDKWNERNPDMPIKINMAAVRQRVRSMNSSKEERIAKTAPKAVRGEVRAALAVQQ